MLLCTLCACTCTPVLSGRCNCDTQDVSAPVILPIQYGSTPAFAPVIPPVRPAIAPVVPPFVLPVGLVPAPALTSVLLPVKPALIRIPFALAYCGPGLPSNCFAILGLV